MSVPIHEAAEALAPFLTTGADSAMRELAGRAGSGLSRAAIRLIGKIQPLLTGSAPEVSEIEQALRAGLAEGAVSPLEVEAIVSMQNSGRDSLSIKVGDVEAGGNVNIGNTVHMRDHDG